MERSFVAVAAPAIAEAVASFPRRAGVAPSEATGGAREVIPAAPFRRVLGTRTGQVRPKLATEGLVAGLDEALAVTPATGADPANVATPV